SASYRLSEGHLVIVPLVAKLAAVISRVGLLLLLWPIEEADVVRHNLRHPPPAAVPRGVAPVLHPPLDGHQAALAQVVGACLGQLAPRHDGKEVSLPLALLVLDRPVHGDAKSGHRVALWCVAEVWIRRQSADQNHTIQHVITSSLYSWVGEWARSQCR